ncbi:MAG: type II toxin-antitoxin system YafQ family toxin [Spirochaetaceae bacterium]|nr:type II toxin-antitoxin system YafQ family toxin [Spirochaetaceae bacterium]
MLEIVYTNQFKRDYRRAVRRNEDVEELFLVIDLLAKGQPLPQEKRDYALSGLYAGYRECHVRPDFLLVYKIVERRLELILYRAGTHSDLF